MALYGNDPLIRACSQKTELDKCFPGNLVKFIDHRHRWVTAIVLLHRYDYVDRLVIHFLSLDGTIIREYWEFVEGNILFIASCK